MMRDLRLLLAMLPLLAIPAAATAQVSEAPIQLAQYYEPGVAGIAEIYIDEFGRRVVIDEAGRIVAIEEPRRERFRERRREFQERGAIIDAPPPPGVTLQGRVDLPPPPGVFEDPGFAGPPPSADPYYDGPYEDDRGYNAAIEGAPLPDAGGPVQEAELPRGLQELPGYQTDLPEPGAPIVEGQTIRETDPAPQVAMPTGKNAKAEIAALQVLLDRAGMSPGVIDGRMGSNVNKAVAAYQEKYGRTLPTGDSKALAEELDATGGPAIVTYEITAEDVSGPYVASIPSDYGEKALLPAMSYERVSEKLAEKFHMDEAYLIEINPRADFNRQGTRLKVMAVGENVKGEVARIVADKGREQVRAYAADGSLIAAYPSTIGSSDTPSPSGVVQVNRIAFDPNYTYNPKVNFKQGENDKVLTIPPGPNGPVGTVWIALSKPTYGIHGTPEPSQIGKTNSHGCVRLTNWDATELAKMVKAGVTVEFEE
ncbi:L,D-transpeptidase family protein [Aurantimonas endophytica]|uniref:Lipoprotein-anchoring transpeptidase ErfK/SrfK n=1 Tax=Aurantimonas endophytica TaxID=1522175 RepID=A0A7W6HI96_9HYPH|nr:L,D-transpeptidase [Aurantimonas endophytica]MBB4005755.1 lipoprotein-anchoring transpeptidase ErfK/SrfK [Aurantimonas endophytica]MCO6406295.1 L,D-transpeptidase family protein [Aurantimonas endophytica]